MADLGFSRRPLRSRQSGWAKGLASLLARLGMTPNAISAAGLGFSLIGAGCYPMVAVHTGLRLPLLVAAAGCVQLRLVCNLVDGMVAVEHGRAGPLGPLWNEVPDRFSDAVLLVGAGYGAAMGASWAEPLGWLGAVLAVGTAYVRELGRALGFAADFSGPGAKPQRMAILTLLTLLEAVRPWPRFEPPGLALQTALTLVSMLAAATIAVRLAHITHALKTAAKASPDA